MAPKRGIAAGSASATTELWVLLCASLGRLVRRFPLITFGVHVDDLTGTGSGEDNEALADEIVLCFEEVGKELIDECGMEFAQHKLAVAASSEQLALAIASRIGAAEAGVSVRKLGADYTLQQVKNTDFEKKAPSRT